MRLVVTGISQTQNMSALKAALQAAGIPLGALQVVSPDDSTPTLASGIAGAGLMTSDGGASIPGINSGGGGGRAFFRNESLSDRLGDFEIPESELDNYVEAVERGRSIVAYFAHAENIDQVEAAFVSAGLTKIKRF